MSARDRIRVALIGCGAVAERCHGPALAGLEAAGEVDVIGLCDPDEQRRLTLGAAFPGAASLALVEELVALRPDLAIVASPAARHAEQSIALLDAGSHVLCEKPMAADTGEADRMIAAAARARRILAVGLTRRFLPATETIRSLVRSNRLGAFASGTVADVGGFDWPFRSSAPFDRQSTPGGVLLDVGPHVFDLLTWWFGPLAVTAYQDDAMGGAEATAVCALTTEGGAPVRVHLSRDWPIARCCDLRFQHGRIVWNGVDPEAIRLELTGVDPAGLLVQSAGRAADCFVAQLRNVVGAIRGDGAVAVSGADARASVELIERCYGIRQLLCSPWFGAAEQSAARARGSEAACSG